MANLSSKDKTYVLIAILLAMFLGAIDQTIVSTALPRIVEDLDGVNRYAWVATAYLLASTILVPIYGKLSDTYSRKKIELTAVTIFLSGSFLCGLSGEFGRLPILGDGMNQLIIFRALQGIGGAGLMSMAFIIIADLYPPRERGKYQGFVGATFGISSVLGPWIGGLLTDYGGNIIPGIEGWRWVFYVNVPFGAIALWFIITKMPILRPTTQKQSLDYISAFFLLAGLTPLILGLQLDKTIFPWTGTTTLALFAVSIIMLAGFVWRSLGNANPILDLTLFKNRVFTTANLSLFFLGAGFLNLVIWLPLYMVNVLGVSATKAGTSIIPLSLGMVFGAIVSGQLVSRIGHYKRFMLGGGIVLIFGTYLLSRMTPEISTLQVTLYMIICGLGVGPSLPLYTLAIQNAVDPRKVGQATSSSQFFRQIGGTIGAAVLGTVLATSLATAFSGNNLPGLSAPSVAGGESQISAAGGNDITNSIIANFETQYETIATAINNDDLSALETTLSSSPLPAEAQSSLLLAAQNSTTPEAKQTLLSQLKTQFDQQAQSTAEQASNLVKNAFADAITTIFLYVTIIASIGWLLTFTIPELELRRSNESPVVAMAD